MYSYEEVANPKAKLLFVCGNGFERNQYFHKSKVQISTLEGNFFGNMSALCSRHGTKNHSSQPRCFHMFQGENSVANLLTWQIVVLTIKRHDLLCHVNWGAVMSKGLALFVCRCVVLSTMCPEHITFTHIVIHTGLFLLFSNWIIWSSMISRESI